MADRRVTHSRKNRDGDITAIGTPGQYWSPRAKTDAISDIELRVHTYYVQWPEKRTEVRVVDGATGKYPSRRSRQHDPQQPGRPSRPVTAQLSTRGSGRYALFALVGSRRVPPALRIATRPTKTYTKRDTTTGRFIDGKSDSKPFKGVRRED